MTTEEIDRRALDLFTQTCGLSADERNAALDRACADNAVLRQRVELMFAADAAPSGPLGTDADVDGFLVRRVRHLRPDFDPASALTADGPAVDSEYTILRVIGEGGMGT